MNGGLPVTLTHLTSRLSLVIGGGEIAERKVHALLDANARVRVLAPTVTDELSDLARGGKIEWLPRAFHSGDLAEAFLVIAATDDAQVNRDIAREAQARGQLVNVVDGPDYCNFFAPAVVRRGGLTIAIGTGGDVPALAAYLRAQFEQQFGNEWGEYVEWLARIRGRIAARYPDLTARRHAWTRVFDSDLCEFIVAHSGTEIEKRISEILDECE